MLIVTVKCTLFFLPSTSSIYRTESIVSNIHYFLTEFGSRLYYDGNNDSNK